MGKPIGMNVAMMKMLANSLYEYKKGVRQLFMTTMSADDVPLAQKRLEKDGVAYYLHRVNDGKTNVFFGKPAWVDTARLVVNKPLSRLSPQEDFILGTLLGYDREQQCLRLQARMGEEDGRSMAVA